MTARRSFPFLVCIALYSGIFSFVPRLAAMAFFGVGFGEGSGTAGVLVRVATLMSMATSASIIG
jgi:hypothetical protein